MQAQKLPKGATKEIKNGVEIINNIDTPLYPNKKIKLVEDLSIGGEVKNGEDPKGEILNLTDFCVGIDNRIYAIENETIAKVFDEKGSLIKTICREGSGPGEVRHVLDLSILKDGRILILDMMGRKAIYFDKNYKFQKSYLFVPVGGYSFNFNYSFINETYVKEIDSKGKIDFKRLTFDGKTVETVLSFDVKVIPENEDHYPGEYIYITENKFSENIHIAPTHDYHIKVYDKNWKLVKVINKPYKKIKVSKEEKESLNKHLQSANRVFNEKKTLVIKEFNRAIGGLHTDDNGKIWVRTFEEKKENNIKYVAWDIINQEGIFEAKVWLRDDVWIRSIQKQKIYAYYFDKETEESFIKRYKYTIE